MYRHDQLDNHRLPANFLSNFPINTVVAPTSPEVYLYHWQTDHQAIWPKEKQKYAFALDKSEIENNNYL